MVIILCFLKRVLYTRTLISRGILVLIGTYSCTCVHSTQHRQLVNLQLNLIADLQVTCLACYLVDLFIYSVY